MGPQLCSPIEPAAQYTKNQYILVAKNYLTKWVKAKALRSNSAAITARFLYEHILAQFGCLLTIFSNHGTHFINEPIKHPMEHFMVQLRTLTTYYPQVNGWAKSTNNVIG